MTNAKYQGVWRDPPESTQDYPDLWVTDNCQSGSINIGEGRLPMWAIISTAVREGWKEVEGGWSPTEHYGFTVEDLATFLYSLLEMRGEFGRLLLTLADVERREQNTDILKDDRPWWERPRSRSRVLASLRRCIDVLEQVEPKKPYSNWRRVAHGVASYDFKGDA